MSLSETTVYLKVKKHLKSSGWSVLAGQPPSGTDHLPVIEIKDDFESGNGSKGSFKPDLVAWKDDILVFIELKPIFNAPDQAKVENVLNSPRRIQALWEDLNQRRVKINTGELLSTRMTQTRVVGGLGYGGTQVDHPHLWTFLVEGDEVVEIPATRSSS